MSIILIAILFLVGMAACARQPGSPAPVQYSEAPAMQIDQSKDYFATVKIAKGGEFLIQLFPEKAPITVNSFVFLAREGFYDGVTFHRVIEGFMAQGGDPTGGGAGGPAAPGRRPAGPGDARVDPPGLRGVFGPAHGGGRREALALAGIRPCRAPLDAAGGRCDRSARQQALGVAMCCRDKDLHPRHHCRGARVSRWWSPLGSFFFQEFAAKSITLGRNPDQSACWSSDRWIQAGAVGAAA